MEMIEISCFSFFFIVCSFIYFIMPPKGDSVEEGEILRLSPDGSRASETFSMKKLYQFQLCQSPYYGSCWPDVQDNTGYADELRRMAPAFGFSAKDVDTLLRGGMLPEEIEEYFYCTVGREDVWFGMCSDS